tara:strand:- start:464 stop:622 length:159 start_codon:yes stop_codon:yes gene_type:complete
MTQKSAKHFTISSIESLFIYCKAPSAQCERNTEIETFITEQAAIGAAVLTIN